MTSVCVLLCAQFFGFFRTYREFSSTMDSCTENWECMVYDNKHSKTNNVEDCVFWYKASTDLPRFHLCSDAFKVLHDRHIKVEGEVGDEHVRTPKR